MSEFRHDRRLVLSGIAGTAAAGVLPLGAMRAFPQDRPSWTLAKQIAFSAYCKTFVTAYKHPIDCADLAVLGLVRFAAANGLPLRLFDYVGRSQNWYDFTPGETDPAAFSKLAMRELGAVNLIENSVPIKKSELRAGDLILTERNAPDSTGHTRIVTNTEYDADAGDWMISWSQGSIPPKEPESRRYLFRDMPNPHKLPMLPRRWNFAQFDGPKKEPSATTVGRSGWRYVKNDETDRRIVREYSDGSRLEFEMSGLRVTSESITASNAAWKSIPATDVQVKFEPDLGEIPAELRAESRVTGGRGVIWNGSIVHDTVLSRQFANARRVKFLAGGRLFADLPLDGSGAALRMLEREIGLDYEAYRRRQSGEETPRDGAPDPDLNVPYPTTSDL